MRLLGFFCFGFCIIDLNPYLNPFFLIVLVLACLRETNGFMTKRQFESII